MVVELTNKDKPETDDDGVFKNKNGTVATSTNGRKQETTASYGISG